jgi:regulator of PEP synthase PpsR (kinase-PPPase family)
VGEYADPDFVRREIHWARQLFARQAKWRVIDVTNKSIEEISSEILLLKGGENDS